MNIGNKISELRKKNNLTQEKLAEKINVSRQTLSNWESNITSPNLEQASMLSKELKVKIDELVDNNIDIICKENKEYTILNNLVGKTCNLELSDDYFDMYLQNTLVKVLEINNDFIKIEYLKNREKCIKLIDIDLIISIKVLEED